MNALDAKPKGWADRAVDALLWVTAVVIVIPNAVLMVIVLCVVYALWPVYLLCRLFARADAIQNPKSKIRNPK